MRPATTWRVFVTEYVRRDPLARCDIRVMGDMVLFVSGNIKSEADLMRAPLCAAPSARSTPCCHSNRCLSNGWTDALVGAASSVSVFGYACDELRTLPPTVTCARRAVEEIERLRKEDPTGIGATGF